MLFKQSRLWLKYLKIYFARVTMIPSLPVSSLMHRYLYLSRKRSNSDLGHLCTQVQKRIERKKNCICPNPSSHRNSCPHCLGCVRWVSAQHHHCAHPGAVCLVFQFASLYVVPCWEATIIGLTWILELWRKKKSLWWRIDSDKDFILLSTPSAERALLSAETEPWIARFQCCRREMGLGYKAGSHIN